MNIKEYVKKEKERLDRFESHWINENEKDSSLYPIDIDGEQNWIEQYIAFQDIELL